MVSRVATSWAPGFGPCCSWRTTGNPPVPERAILFDFVSPNVNHELRPRSARFIPYCQRAVDASTTTSGHLLRRADAGPGRAPQPAWSGAVDLSGCRTTMTRWRRQAVRGWTSSAKTIVPSPGGRKQIATGPRGGTARYLGSVASWPRRPSSRTRSAWPARTRVGITAASHDRRGTLIPSRRDRPGRGILRKDHERRSSSASPVDPAAAFAAVRRDGLGHRHRSNMWPACTHGGVTVWSPPEGLTAALNSRAGAAPGTGDTSHLRQDCLRSRARVPAAESARHQRRPLIAESTAPAVQRPSTGRTALPAGVPSRDPKFLKIRPGKGRGESFPAARAVILYFLEGFRGRDRDPPAARFERNGAVTELLLDLITPGLAGVCRQLCGRLMCR